MTGSGVTHAIVLGRASTQQETQARMAAHPGRVKFFASVDVAGGAAEAVAALRKAVRLGASGFGEMKSQVAADGPEMRAVYDLAAELGVPVLLHFQEVNQQASAGTFNTGLARSGAILKA